jgi:hypothetical protein
MSVTDLELDWMQQGCEPPPLLLEHLRPTYRRLNVIPFLVGGGSYSISSQELWKAMPMIESIGNDDMDAEQFLCPLRIDLVISEAKDLTYFPHHLGFVEFSDDVTLNIVNTILEQSKKLRTIIFPQQPSFDLSAFSLSFPDSLTSLRTPHGLDLFNIPKSLKHLHLLPTTNSESNSILPPRIDFSPLLLPFHLETLTADIWSFRFIKNGFQVLPSTLRKLELVHAATPTILGFTDHLHCVDLPTSLTSLHVSTNTLPLWCGEISGSPNLSASLRRLVLDSDRGPSRPSRIEFAVWAPPNNRHIPFPNLTSLVTPIWHVDDKYWENFPKRIQHLNVTCYEDSFRHFTSGFLNGFHNLLTAEIDSDVGEHIRLIPYLGFDTWLT